MKKKYIQYFNIEINKEFIRYFNILIYFNIQEMKIGISNWKV